VRLRTNNIAVTVVGFAILVALVPLLLGATFLARVLRRGDAPAGAPDAAHAAHAANTANASDAPRSLWAVLDELSHARLL
jgi:hypothetical protein